MPTLLDRRRFCLQLGARAAVLAAGLGGALATAKAAAADGASAPEAPSHPPAPLDLDWLDSRRQRPVPVRLYLPAEAHGPAPLVVFSHGIGGSRRGYSYLGRHFAANGIASLHLQHVGSDRQLWMGNLFSLVGRLQDAAQPGEALARVMDLRFALDTLLAGPLAERVDARHIIAAGHSYGANTTLLVAGAQVPPQGQPLPPLRDERVRAAIAISAPPFYGQADLRPILGPIALPSLHITATEDVIRIPGYYSGAEDRLAVYRATGSLLPRPQPKWLAVFEGGSHAIFTDRAGTGGALLNPQVKAATQALTLAFVRAVTAGDDAALRVWPQQHAALLARFEAVAG